MMYTKDKVEEMVPSAEEKEEEEIEEEVEEEEEEEAEEGGEEEEEEETEEEEKEEGGADEDDEEQEDGEKKNKDEAVPQAAEKNNPMPTKPREKKQPEGLNLNNEVVKMRKEVKRVRALIIRKLTRQIGSLKKKKGKDQEIERNQRRATRLLEEIHAMKVLSPDVVTKTALQKTLNFEHVCKNPKSTLSDRATARIATHPQFNKKIEDIKAAVKAFKEERMKDGARGGKEKVQNKPVKVTPQSPDKNVDRKSEKEEEDAVAEQKEITDIEEGESILKVTKDAGVAEAEKETEKVTLSAATADDQRNVVPELKNVRTASIKSSEVKDKVKNTPQSIDAEKKPDQKKLQKQQDVNESDLESSDDEEKEYFDDSTEERFHKQSSQSEESDDDNDFFIGKVSKFKKKKQKNVEGEKVKKGPEVKADQVQSELDELESRLKSKGSSLQSVFCSSLSASKSGGGRGRGGDKFRGQGKPKGGSGPNRDFSKHSKFQKQEKGPERNPGSKYNKPWPESRQPESSEKGFPSEGRGRGRGRGDAFRQKDHRGGRAFSHQAPQPALHPSWEASKKRKEQQGQILAFQGKKIKFDDDD